MIVNFSSTLQVPTTHVILTGLCGFTDKIVIFQDCLVIPKRDVSPKKTKPNIEI